MEQLTTSAETFLRLLEQDFYCEIANHEIGSEHVKYSSLQEARMAMLRLAYLRGKADATEGPEETFDQVVAAVVERNRAARMER